MNWRSGTSAARDAGAARFLTMRQFAAEKKMKVILSLPLGPA
jgi:hypothetical protein